MANLETPTADAVLVRCPACKAWPMAVNVVKTAWGFRKSLLFTCPKCRFSTEPESR